MSARHTTTHIPAAGAPCLPTPGEETTMLYQEYPYQSQHHRSQRAHHNWLLNEAIRAQRTERRHRRRQSR